jgi:hypothetical protein
MGSRLHLCPERLRGHAGTAVGLADDLRAALERSGAAEPSSDRLSRAVRRIADELVELAAALTDVAGAADRADLSAVRRIELLSDTRWPGLR